MHEITKTYRFSASHQLDGLPDGHKCSRLHGHSYTVTLGLRSRSLDHLGMVVDYASLDVFGDWLAKTCDHRHLGRWDMYDQERNLLGEAAFDFNPTAENLAAEFYGMALPVIPYLAWVEVRESDKTSARYEP